MKTTASTSTRAAEVIAVRPGPPLAGTVAVDGSKNATLPCWPPQLPSAAL